MVYEATIEAVGHESVKMEVKTRRDFGREVSKLLPQVEGRMKMLGRRVEGETSEEVFVFGEAREVALCGGG